MKKQSGFTLIELVIVIVILGLLAVTAIPKFLDITDQAKQANIEGMAGGFATAASLVRAQWEAEGRPNNGTQNIVSYDGVQLVLTTEDFDNGIRPGYPTGLTNGASLGGGFGADNCKEIWDNIFQQPAALTDSYAAGTIQDFEYLVNKNGSGETSLCHFYLVSSLTTNASGVPQNPGTSDTEGNKFTYQPATSAVVVYINNND